ncbi:MAG: hypothetical protein RBJ76_13145 [Stenomitos frigidus ULC029]
MNKPKIVIPSKGRADRITTTKAINNAILCVCESQADLYREHNPNTEIVVHPDEVEQISYPAKLQWILDYFGDVFYLDDDVTYMVRHWVEVREPVKVTPEKAEQYVYAAHEMATAIGAYYWGFNTNKDPRTYFGHKPFRLTGMCWGNGTGIRGNAPGCKLFWNTSLKTNEDYWIALLNAHYHRYAFFDDRFKFNTTEPFRNPGGAALYRTVDLERQAYEQLRNHFGEAIGLKKDTAIAKRKHEWQPALRIPF